MAAFQRLLVPTDFSDCAAAAAGVAARLARQLGCRVDVITVVDTRPLFDAYGDEAFRDERIAAIRGAAAALLDDFVPAHFSGCEVSQAVRDGDAFSEILEAAKETGADLIVMGTHGRAGLAHLLIGSVAEKTVRHSPVPVLTVRRD